MIIAFLILATVESIVARVQALDAPKAAHPNILLMYTDDQGWADLAVQGVDENIRTPSIDQLARDGVLFRRGYVTAP